MHMKILPAFDINNIPIVFSANEMFVPITAVMIQSIIENSASFNNYDIIILTSDISNYYVGELEKMVESLTNFSIRVIDISERVKNYNFYTENRQTITVETYFRLFIPDLMYEYTKVIYLDGDMIANIDIAELYNIEIDNYFLISSRDCDGIGRYHKPGDDRKIYRDQVLKLQNPDNYFCAGMLVMNLELFRKELPSQKLLEFATSYNWEWHDQDVLNVLCEGRVKLVDMAWDVLRDAGNNSFMPTEFYAEFLESERNPKIIHYGGVRKPWIYFDVERGEYFWRYVGKTPFYRQILSMVNDTNIKRYGDMSNANIGKKEKDDSYLKDSVHMQFKEGKIGFKYIIKYFKAWMNFKMRKK